MEIINLRKSFDKKIALQDLNLNIKKGSIYGLVGTNGGGKTTLMNIASGVYKPDHGKILIDNQDVHKNDEAKAKVFFVPDDTYFFQNFTLENMANFYKGIYNKTWDNELYKKLVQKFPIKANVRLKSFSKGMKRQAFLILAISARTEYLLLDEVFDGLDAVIRVAIRKIIADIVSEHGMTVIIASHNLRELEDFCDTVALIHDGKLVLEQSLFDISDDYCKAQVAFKTIPNLDELSENKLILSKQINGSFVSVCARMSQTELETLLLKYKPDFMQFVSLSLEEVFVNEMEAIGYDYNQIIL